MRHVLVHESGARWKELLRGLVVILACAAICPGARAADRPNIVFILADDLGYGDLKCLNPEGKIATPHIDRLAAGGMTFTDAHSGSAVCTPTRYGILTGRYSWRSRLKEGVLFGYSPRLIEPGRLTVASFLKQQGYATACIGKWHLGMNWPLKEGGFARDDPDGWKVDYTKPIQDGPTTLGFDEYFGISASLDMPPYTFIENDRVAVIPTTEKQWIRKGPAAESFEAVDVLPTLTRKAVDYLSRRAPAAKEGKPFFLYLPLNAPHTPILPTAEWKGKSGLNDYGDFVMQVDQAVGRVLDTLEKLGLTENTLVFLASDNGCSPSANFKDLLAKGHNPNDHFRGSKADIFEGGHRIPFLARWPGRIKAHSTSDQLICLGDFFATCAEIVGVTLPANAAEDSVSLLPALEGRATGPLHEAVVHHSVNGSFAIRQGKWKLELCPGSGGWSDPRPESKQARGLPPMQLYDLSADIGEKVNLQAQHPEVVERLTALLKKYVDDGRSTPGAPQPNNGKVVIERPRRSIPAGAGGPPPKRRPNVLFLFTDDQRADTIHALGNPTIQTPNLDRLAESGFSFRNAYCMGGNIQAVCLPSRTMMLSGRSLFHLGELTSGSPNFPKSMKVAGYVTYHHGKRGNTPQKIQSDFDFNHYLRDDEQERRSGHPGKEIADDAIRFLREYKKDKPFFMYLAFANPHDPRVVVDEDRSRYDESKMPLPKNYRPLHPFNNGDLLLRDEALAPWPRTPEVVRKHLTDYYGVITHLDREIGRILQALREIGEEKMTIIIVSSDHGLALGSHGLMGKQNLYEDGMKVPLVFNGPGIPRGSSEAYVYLYDIYPTICALVGANVPESLDGRSLLPILRGERAEVRDAIFLAYRSVQRSVRRGDWKLIRYPQVNKTQLFDLKADPHEIDDLASDPRQESRVKEMLALLEQQQRAFGDTLPLTSEHPGPAAVDTSFFPTVSGATRR